MKKKKSVLFFVFFIFVFLAFRIYKILEENKKANHENKLYYHIEPEGDVTVLSLPKEMVVKEGATCYIATKIGMLKGRILKINPKYSSVNIKVDKKIDPELVINCRVYDAFKQYSIGTALTLIPWKNEYNEFIVAYEGETDAHN